MVSARSLSGHQSAVSLSVDWITPRWILDRLGDFDLDPCASMTQPWNTARDSFTMRDDGLSREWSGRVYLNPPFGRESQPWIERMADHGSGIAMLPARTETRMWFERVWGTAEAVCFLRGRPHFCRPDGSTAPFNSGAPIALIAYSPHDDGILRMSGLGWTVRAK